MIFREPAEAASRYDYPCEWAYEGKLKPRSFPAGVCAPQRFCVKKTGA